MSIVRNAFLVWKSEGLHGLLLRLNLRFCLLKIWCASLVGRRDLKSSYGPRFTMNVDDATFHSYISAWYGKFYWDHVSQIERPFVFVDIGANQGLYSICALQNPSNVATLAFEPVHKTYELLCANIKLNGLKDGSVLVNKAISSSCAISKISITKGHSGAASLAGPAADESEIEETISIETIDGEAFADLFVDYDAPLIIKVDVEGFEPVVIREVLESSIAPQIAEIFYEVHEDWVVPGEIEQLLKQVGFVSFRRIGQGRRYDMLASRSNNGELDFHHGEG